ncbi:nuclear transport factor 2 family protein [Pararhizobium sp.]|uniref:nuclear transport factor 2 family protein n=1 Tax=Pararhizobium sp. TaxID=1977563 RepID=UPI00272070F4|nr:nuclear transport factor 2 family protein [Pararhizobium sp.]MDO9414699.1 nuclear transport factor 2 family protein [Pararhizobium sp.]
MTKTQTLASSFLEALNQRDFSKLAALVDEDVALDTMVGQRTIGAEPMRMAVAQYFRHFDEQFLDIVLMSDAFGQRIAADVTANGHYRETLAGLSNASGQSYAIPAVFVFEIEGGAITRISHYRNTAVFARVLSA